MSSPSFNVESFGNTSPFFISIILSISIYSPPPAFKLSIIFCFMLCTVSDLSTVTVMSRFPG